VVPLASTTAVGGQEAVVGGGGGGIAHRVIDFGDGQGVGVPGEGGLVAKGVGEDGRFEEAAAVEGEHARRHPHVAVFAARAVAVEVHIATGGAQVGQADAIGEGAGVGKDLGVQAPGQGQQVLLIRQGPQAYDPEAALGRADGVAVKAGDPVADEAQLLGASACRRLFEGQQVPALGRRNLRGEACLGGGRLLGGLGGAGAAARVGQGGGLQHISVVVNGQYKLVAHARVVGTRS
jgi:hypothetical protein